MQRSRLLFVTGKYHQRFGKNHIHFLRNIQLRASYRTSSSLVSMLGWPDPLRKQTPRILLCGTASPHTTVEFARFVSQYNTQALIDVLDISRYPLLQSEQLITTCSDINPANFSFVEADALHMPFPDKSFDWIETDFFIQFFSAEEKAHLFKEWYRVLKPGGVVTTRDWLLQKQDFTERLLGRIKNWLVLHTLGPVVYIAQVREVEEMLRAIGFEVAVCPAVLPIIRSKLPLLHYISIYRPD